MARLFTAAIVAFGISLGYAGGFDGASVGAGIGASAGGGFGPFSAGYRIYSKDEHFTPRTPANLDGVSISYEALGGTEFEHCVREFVFPFEQTLRSRYGVFDIRRVQESMNPNDGSFFIAIACKTEEHGKFFKNLNLFTFGAIPATWSTRHVMDFTVSSPNAENKTFQYSYTERTIAWLPFLMLGPRYGITAGQGKIDEGDNYQGTRVHILRDIAIHFLDDASPALSAHAHGPHE